MARHPNHFVRRMELVGHSLADLLVAYPGKDEAYLEQVLRDNAFALSRPVIPYGLLGIHPCESRYFNVSEHGFRSVGRPQPWPPASDKQNIFLLGGSSTVGFNIEDRETIAAHLQSILDEADMRCEVYNFGSGNYASRHESLRFLDLVDRGQVPDYVIFLDGYNDSFYAFGNPDLVNALDYLYQSEKKYRRSSYIKSLVLFAFSAYFARRKPLPSTTGYHPGRDNPELIEYLSDSGITNALRQSTRSVPTSGGTAFEQAIADRVWSSYLDSVAMVRSLSLRYRVKTLFFWQPVPFFKTTSEQRVLEGLYRFHRYGVLTAPVYSWLEHYGYPDMLGCDDFFSLADLGVGESAVLYVDECHYSGRFNQMIAQAISAKLIPQLDEHQKAAGFSYRPDEVDSQQYPLT